MIVLIVLKLPLTDTVSLTDTTRAVSVARADTVFTGFTVIKFVPSPILVALLAAANETTSALSAAAAGVLAAFIETSSVALAIPILPIIAVPAGKAASNVALVYNLPILLVFNVE